MTRTRLAFIGILSLGACQRGRSELPAGYAADVDTICHQEERSGALDQPEGERALSTAYWLERNLKTPEGRKLAASIFPLKPAAKAERLSAEASKAGVSSCPTADSWRGGREP